MFRHDDILPLYCILSELYRKDFDKLHPGKTPPEIKKFLTRNPSPNQLLTALITIIKTIITTQRKDS